MSTFCSMALPTILWFVLGALLTSVGNTAASRIARPVGRRAVASQDDGSLGEEVIQALSRLVSSLLVGSRCDSCNEELRIKAIIPIIGVCWGCSKKKCSMPEGALVRYTALEVSGGVLMATSWLMFNHSAQSIVATVLIIVLLSFMLSLKEHVYDSWELVEELKVPEASLKRIVNFFLTATFGLVGIGAAIPIDLSVQVAGLILFAWLGWLFGLRHLRANKQKYQADRRVTEYPVRCFAMGLLAGAWFGLMAGWVVTLITWGVTTLSKRKSHRNIERYLEEVVLMASLGLLGMMAALNDLSPYLSLSEYLGWKSMEIPSVLCKYIETIYSLIWFR